MKLLVPNGNWIMEGLSQGLEEGKKGLRDTLNGIASTISSTKFNASASLSYAGGSAASMGGFSNGNTYNVYINGAKINDDAQIQSKFMTLLNEMARKGMM